MNADPQWFRRYRPSPTARSRLVCLPHAGGSASGYLPLADRLAPDVDVLVVQYPGRMERHREPMAGSLAALADQIADLIRLDPDPRPLALYGYSMGATIAYEVARRLEQSTAPAPVRLFVSARRAPSRPSVDQSLPHRGSDDVLVEHLEMLGGTAPKLLDDPGIRDMVLPIVRGDYAMLESYRWQPGTVPLACPISVFVGDADPITPVDDARAWQQHTTGGSDLIVLQGGHFLLDTGLGRIAERLLAHLTVSDLPTPMR